MGHNKATYKMKKNNNKQMTRKVSKTKIKYYKMRFNKSNFNLKFKSKRIILYLKLLQTIQTLY